MVEELENHVRETVTVWDIVLNVLSQQLWVEKTASKDANKRRWMTDLQGNVSAFTLVTLLKCAYMYLTG